MNIKLKRLYLRNFKGVKELNIDFTEKVTNVNGQNGTGKTTIFDGFVWLLFDKDSQMRTNFEIETLDEDNNVIHGLEHEVTGALEVDNTEITLEKIYKEKWTQRKGEADKRLTGHTTDYYIDQVPVKKKEYQEKINSIIDENIFKLITNPTQFNLLNWKDRRKILFEIAGNVDDKEIISSNKNLMQLENLLEDKKLEDFKKIVASRKKKLKEERQSIPYRIDECNNSVQEVHHEVYIKEDIVKQLNSVENQLLDNSKVDSQKLNKQKEIYELQHELQDLEWQAKLKADQPKMQLEKTLQDINFNLNNSERSISLLKQNNENLDKNIATYTELCNKQRNKWYFENDTKFEFDEKLGICPVCKRPFPKDQIETKRAELEANFNANKATALKQITEQGKAYKELVNKHKAQKEQVVTKITEELKNVEELKASKVKIEDKIKNYRVEVIPDNKQKELKAKISTLEEELKQPNNSMQIIEKLKARKQELNDQLKTLERQEGIEVQNAKLKARMDKLQAREKELSNMIAELEGQEFLCEEFIKTKVNYLEDKINSLFQTVKFKLFKTLVNGGIDECCETLINGVPYFDANSASRTNGGLDIINTLCNYYKVNAPVFIDNRESVNDLIKTNSQLINLIVSTDTKLNIKNIHVPTAEEKEELKQIVEKLKEQLDDYSTYLEVPEDFEFIKEGYGEKHRWWQYKYEYYQYKGQFIEFSYQEPLTEQQEGQETDPEINIIEQI